jgi:hypothetical protein
MRISIIAKIALGKTAVGILTDIYNYTRRGSEDGRRFSEVEEKMLGKKVIQFVKQLIFNNVIKEM